MSGDLKFTEDDLRCWPHYRSYFVDILNGEYNLLEAISDLRGLVGSRFDPRSPQDTVEGVPEQANNSTKVDNT